MYNCCSKCTAPPFLSVPIVIRWSFDPEPLLPQQWWPIHCNRWTTTSRTDLLHSVISRMILCDISTLVRSFHTDCNWSPLCSRPQQETAKLAQSSILQSTIRPVYLKLFLSFAFSQCSSHNMVSSTESTFIYWWDTNTVPVVCLCVRLVSTMFASEN